MKMLQESDLAKIKFKEEKDKIIEGLLKKKYSFHSLLTHLNTPKIQDKAAWFMSGVI